MSSFCEGMDFSLKNIKRNQNKLYGEFQNCSDRHITKEESTCYTAKYTSFYRYLEYFKGFLLQILKRICLNVHKYQKIFDPIECDGKISYFSRKVRK